jgi:hypothetical protein
MDGRQAGVGSDNGIWIVFSFLVVLNLLGGRFLPLFILCRESCLGKIERDNMTK